MSIASRRLLLVPVAALAGACATAHTSPASGIVGRPFVTTTGRPSTGRAPGAALTAESLDSLPAGLSLLDALRRLRPEYLVSRSPSPAAPAGHVAAVYLNGAPHGDVTILATIPAAMVTGVGYLRPGDATARLGTTLPGGALLITTRR